MRFQLTILERALAALPEKERAERLRAEWGAFRASPHFDFVVAILRDVERQALETIRGRPTADLRGSAMALHVVDLIRRSFTTMTTAQDASGTEWSDAEEFLDEEKEVL